MNDEKQIAQAILDAQKIHEESYKPAQTELFGSTIEIGEYSKDWEDCFIEACKKNKLSPNFWYVLHLANHWINDIQGWAEDILAGKTTYGVGITIEKDKAVITYGTAMSEEAKERDDINKSNNN